MEKKKYIEPKMKVMELDTTSILAGSLDTYDGGATQSLDDIDDTPSDNGSYRPNVIFD